MGSAQPRAARRACAQHRPVRLLLPSTPRWTAAAAGPWRRCGAAAGGDPPRWVGAARSDRRRRRGRARRPHAAQRRDLRSRDPRGGTGRAGRRGLRRLRRSAHPRHRAAGDRRPGRHELDDPQLPGLPARRQRRRAGLSRLGANPALRGPVRLHATRHRADRRASPTM